jgi:hypothetical protein
MWLRHRVLGALRGAQGGYVNLDSVGQGHDMVRSSRQGSKLSEDVVIPVSGLEASSR